MWNIFRYNWKMNQNGKICLGKQLPNDLHIHLGCFHLTSLQF
jgi:hypothetical protein